jgi:hypothetical protein
MNNPPPSRAFSLDSLLCFARKIPKIVDQTIFYLANCSGALAAKGLIIGIFVVQSTAKSTNATGSQGKNDNCFAEQKNYDAVRKTAGYFRFDTPADQEASAEVYAYLCPLYNYRYPSFRLIDKEKQTDGRYKKIYEKSPKTPF